MSSIECTFTSEYTWCVPTYVVILPKITGMISIISSAILAKLMISSPNKKPYHRLLLNISVADILSSSIVHVAGSWLMPQGTAPLSRGNLATCDAQGFLVQIIIVVIPYLNASLSTYYNLIIRYNWSDGQIAKIEKSLHLIPWLLGVLLSVVALVTKQIVPGTWGCWFGNTQYPPNCDSAETCVRGWNSSYYFWPIFVIMVMAPIYVAGSMYLVYTTSRRLEERMSQYSYTDSQRNERRSRKVMVQSLLFSSALLLTLVFPLVEIVINELGKPIPIWIHVLFTLTNPLQGFYNLLIHLRQRREPKEKGAASRKQNAAAATTSAMSASEKKGVEMEEL